MARISKPCSWHSEAKRSVSALSPIIMGTMGPVPMAFKSVS